MTSESGARKKRVLVLDGDQPAALAVVRSLGRRGIDVTSAEKSKARESTTLSALSKWTKSSFIYPDPLIEPERFVALIRDKVNEENYDLVIPMTDDTLQPLARRRADFEGHTILAIAPDEALALMTEKSKTLALARSLGVPCPDSFIMTSTDEIESRAQSLRFPAVLKPAVSIAEGRGGVRAKLTVRYAMDAAGFRQVAKELLEAGPLLVQEYVLGEGVGVEVLCDRGEVVFAFQHVRMHEMPLTGGGSCLRKSTDVDPGLLEHSRKLLAAAKWHGVAMVEWKRDPETGAAWLMEVNGRFWGSLPLACAAGADFPGYLFDLLVEKKRPDPAQKPRPGIICRKLWFDAFWFIEVMRRTDPSPLIRWPSRWSAIQDLCLFLHPSHRFDVQSLFDPRPGWLDFRRTIRDVWSRFSIHFRKQKLRNLMADLRRDRAALEARVRSARRIVFLCYGNINRSILAERAFKSVFHGQDVSCSSCGFHPEENRPADPAMVAAASVHAVDLSDAKSRRVRHDILADADLVCAMDISHLLRIAEEYPDSIKKTVLLGVFAARPDVSLEIADPYGGSPAAYEKAAREVVESVRGLSDLIVGSKKSGNA